MLIQFINLQEFCRIIFLDIKGLWVVIFDKIIQFKQTVR